MSSPPSRFPKDAMKESWSHGDDRRDRGRADRGVPRQRRTPSPPRRPQDRAESERHTTARDRDIEKTRPSSRQDDRRRDRTPSRRRPASRTPEREPAVEDARQRNRGRELLDTRASGSKPRHREHREHRDRSPPPSHRHRSRSLSRDRSHRKKISRRSRSRSPGRPSSDLRAGRSDRSRRVEAPPRRRSRDKTETSRHHSDRPHSDRPRLEKSTESYKPSRHSSNHRIRTHSRGRRESPRLGAEPRRPTRSPQSERRPSSRPTRSPRGERRHTSRPRSPHILESRTGDRKPESTSGSRRPAESNRIDTPRRSDRVSPGPDSSRRSSPNRGRKLQEDYGPPTDQRPGSFKQIQDSQPSASGANSIEVPKRRRPETSFTGANSIEVGNSRQRTERPHSSGRDSTSGPNSVELSNDKMAGRGYGHGGYPNQQMQAAFPLKPQYNQGPPQHVDPRYSQSPQHMTPNHSYHNSPQAMSPYSDGRGGWIQPQQQYSPQHQYPHHNSYGPPQGPQQGYPLSGPQSYHPPHSPSHGYQGPMQHQQQQPYRGGGRGGYRGGHQNQRGNYRGRGGSYQNNMGWNGNAQGGSGLPQHDHSGQNTPQHASSFQQPALPPDGPPQQLQTTTPSEPQPSIEDDDGDLFRPSKDLQVEDTKKPDEETMPPPTRPAPPTGPAANKFSFAFKATSKAPPTTLKPEISQALTAVPLSRQPPTQPSRDNRSPPQGPAAHRSAIPTQPASNRSRPDTRREPPPVRMVKKIMQRAKPRPTLPAEFTTSDSVYYRKPGNESVVGSGTYGKVFKAIHVYTKKLVALKKIRMEGERDGFPVTAVREIKLLQSLKHANVVTLQEVMVEKNDCFMVFEYLSHDLTGLLNHPSFKLEPAHKKHLAKQMFEGLDYLHRRGVLHRDIKAANILVSNEGQLKLADFGLARFYAKRKQLDYTNRVITIWYRSPELLLGETQYGPAVDIWSAACVLVEIFTRHAIFPGDGGEISQLEKIYNVLGTPNVRDWPGLVDMAWFELLRPRAKKANVFADRYKERVTDSAFALLSDMFQYDPSKRPNATEVLEHPYFTIEEPEPRQAIELQALEGDWHEFESKALRKENEKKEKEARRAQREEQASAKDNDKKRGPEGDVAERDTKRVQTAPPGGDVAMPDANDVVPSIDEGVAPTVS